MKPHQKGFSLIELLIVVVIVGVIAAIAIPNMLAARRSANEGSAISSIRTYHGAQLTYQVTKGNGEFAGDPADATVAFPLLKSQRLIDDTLGSGSKSGYLFTGLAVPKTGTTPAQFAGIAKPGVPTGLTATATQNFAVATDGILYSSDSASPTFNVSVVSGLITITGAIPFVAR